MRRVAAPETGAHADAIRMMARFLVRHGPTPEPPDAPAVASNTAPASPAVLPVRRAA